MVKRVTQYGEPILREKGKALSEFGPELHKLIDDMFDTMEAAQGIGLAAQQVGEPLLLCIVDVTGIEDRPSALWLDGEESDVEKFMPLVLINPSIEHVGEGESGPEGCLSFPNIYGDVKRPGKIKVKALDGNGKEYGFECDGLLSRCIQHEVDHLNGILFIDRMEKVERDKIKVEVTELKANTDAWMKSQSQK